MQTRMLGPEMLRRGIDRASIRKAVFDNANAFYGLGVEP